MTKLSELSTKQIQCLPWYYKIELKNGAMTGGRIRNTLSLTRPVLERMGVENNRCLDIGAQEGVLSVLMSRQGASEVVAYDRLNLSEQLAVVSEAYQVELEYFHSLQLNQLPRVIKAAGKKPFDIVVFAGVLYHMPDPLIGLALTRSLLREGGLALIETSVLPTGEHIAKFNSKGRFYKGSNYFQISLGLLDYFLRMLRFEPIDLLFNKTSDTDICRAVIVARAVNRVVAEEDDEWMKKQWIEKDIGRVAHLDFKQLKSNLPAVKYTPANTTLKYYDNTEIIDISASIKASKPVRLIKNKGVLMLNDYV